MGGGVLCCLFSSDAKINFKAAKWFYFGLLTWSAILTWVLRDYGDDAMEKVPGLDGCADNAGINDKSKCFGIGAVLRVSFATALFHASHLLLLIQCKYEEDQRVTFHTSCHGLKFLVWAALVVASFFIPDGFYDVYGEIARVFSGLFLIFQAIVIIDFFYILNEKMLEGENLQWLLILLTSLSYGFSLVVIGLAYHYFAPRGSCSTNIFWITWTLILGVVITVVSLSRWRPENAGLFTSGAVLGYCAFLLISAMNSLPGDNECIRSGGMSGGWIRVLSFLIALGAVLISTMSAGVSEVFVPGSSGEPLPYRPDVFHAIFSLAAMYMAMLFTNWSLEGSTSELSLDKGTHSSWVKIASQWLVFLLYLWTMLAPKILGNRDFT